MGTIRKKALKSGANSYTAQIVRRKFDYTESRTFDTRLKAERWMKKREKEIDLDIEQGQKPIPRSVRATTLAQAIDMCVEASRKEIWSCHAFVPLRLLTYAAFASKAKGLFQPSAECLRRGL